MIGVERQREASLLVKTICPWVNHDFPEEFKAGKSFVYRFHATRTGPNVIAKFATHTSLLNELRAYEFQAELAVETLGTFGIVESGSRDHSWLFIEDAGGQPFDAANLDHRRVLGHWLADLHLASAGHDALESFADRSLAYYQRILTDTFPVLDDALDNPELGDDARAIVNGLLGQCRRLESSWLAFSEILLQAPTVLCHNGIAGKNVHITCDDHQNLRVAAFDWEASGRGPGVADLFCVDLIAYQQRVGERFSPLRDETVLRDLANVGRIVWNLAPIHGERENLIGRWPQRAVGKLEYYANHIRSGLDALESRTS